MGTISKAWLIMTGLLAVLGSGLAIYFFEKNMRSEGMWVLREGGALLVIMIMFFGIVQVFKYMADS